jgi:ubiquinone/menaquinone biosynthesis C-methylase UbiE
MVELPRGRASGAQVVVAQAESLPFDTDAFTAVAMSVVFFFRDDPDRVLHECLRVMRSGGRLANYTTAPELRGTPAAPEPIASRGHFYSDQELPDLAAHADFRDSTVRSEQGGQLLTARA